MSNNWFADKIAPGQVPIRQYVPPGYAPQQQPQQVVEYPQQQAPQGSYNQQAAGLHQIHAADAIAMWRGTKESREGSGHCPKCGGPHFYTYANRSGTEPTRVMREDGTMVQPTGRCFTCGYNGRFEQLGQQGTDLGVVLTT